MFSNEIILWVVDFTELHICSTNGSTKCILSFRPGIYSNNFLYRNSKLGIDGFDSNEHNCEVIKEHHFHISDDHMHMHDTCFFQHCFHIIYKNLKER